VASRAADLRAAFDAAFVAAPPDAPAPTTGLLAVRIGPTPAAIRLSDIAGLHADKVITPLPMAPPELLGLAGFRGTAVPVYDLGALLGAPGTGQPRWCVLAAGRPPVAFAFHHFEGYRRVPLAALPPAGDPGTGGATARRDVVTVDGHPRSIVELPALVAAIAARTARVGNRGEERRR
jgi:purine-binding chemotaxis protein CheW